MKNVLVIYYSQSGQLKSIAQTIAQPLVDDIGVNVTFYEIQLEKPFPFPWTKQTFFGAFPETFLQIPALLKPTPSEIMDTKYDLVLLHYQVWYLSPSIPINSFLKSSECKTLLGNTPVVTISGSRNMWIMAQEKIKKLLNANNANLVGNVALVDRAGNLISVITIVRWMFSGVKKRYLGIFPLPGVSDKDIKESVRFGNIILSSLKGGNLQGLQPRLVSLGAVRISLYLVQIDKAANKVFSKWANFIYRRRKTREKWLRVFNLYLFLVIWLISPIVYILYVLTYIFRGGKIKGKTLYYRGVN